MTRNVKLIVLNNGMELIAKVTPINYLPTPGDTSKYLLEDCRRPVETPQGLALIPWPVFMAEGHEVPIGKDAILTMVPAHPELEKIYFESISGLDLSTKMP